MLQLDGSAPIFSPRSTRLLIVSFAKVPSTGAAQSSGIETTYTSMSALRLSLWDLRHGVETPEAQWPSVAASGRL